MMVAYSFKAGFVRAIEAGTKLHTLRNHRRRHARPGEELQLYTGMRTRSCRLVARKTCTQVVGVFLDFTCSGPAVRLFEFAELVPGEPRRVRDFTEIADVDAFALADGFSAGIDVMARWWRVTHGVRSWSGALIGWGPAYALHHPASSCIAQAERPVPPPWSAEPWRWRPAEVAAELRTRPWHGDGLRTYRSALDPRVIAVQVAAAAAPAYRLDVPGCDGDHASLEDAAEVLLRVDRTAAADREFAA